MAKMMYPVQWPDGSWRYERPRQWSDTVARGPAAEPQPEVPLRVAFIPKPSRPKQGFFRTDDKLPERRAVKLKAQAARLWLSSLLREPRLARDVFAKGKAEGFSVAAIKRAKKRLGIKSRRLGGRGTGKCNPWQWQNP